MGIGVEKIYACVHANVVRCYHVVRRECQRGKMLTIVKSGSGVYKYLLHCFFNRSVVLKPGIMCSMHGDEGKATRMRYTNLGPCQSNDYTRLHFRPNAILSHRIENIYIYILKTRVDLCLPFLSISGWLLVFVGEGSWSLAVAESD